MGVVNGAGFIATPTTYDGRGWRGEASIVVKDG